MQSTGEPMMMKIQMTDETKMLLDNLHLGHDWLGGGEGSPLHLLNMFKMSEQCDLVKF